MDDKIITPPQPDAATNVPAADGPAADTSVSLASLLNTELGKQFPDDATALKAVKDTFGYVGKVGKFAPKLDALQLALGGENNLISKMDELLSTNPQPQPAAQPTDTSNFVTKEQLETERFFDKNPALAPHRSVIEAVQKASGKPLSEALNDPTLKGLIDQAAKGAEIQQSQSVMQSNPRLGGVSDKFTQAGEAAKSGNFAAGADLVTSAVMDAYPDLEVK